MVGQRLRFKHGWWVSPLKVCCGPGGLCGACVLLWFSCMCCLVCVDVLVWVGGVNWCWAIGWPKVAVSKWLAGFPFKSLLGSRWVVCAMCFGYGFPVCVVLFLLMCWFGWVWMNWCWAISWPKAAVYKWLVGVPFESFLWSRWVVWGMCFVVVVHDVLSCVC